MSPLNQVTLPIGTINEELRDYDTLFNFRGQVNRDYLKVTFDFSNCGFLRQNAVAFLGGLARLIESRSGRANFSWDTMEEAVLKNLKKNGFAEAFGFGASYGPGNSIPYRQDTWLNKNALADYLTSKWLGRGWINVSEKLKNAIVEKVLECYLNSFEHSGSVIGVFSCGQHYPQLKHLEISVVDFGVGIPAKVREFKNDGSIGAAQALQWAFRSGTSTRQNGPSGGLGLDLLKQFVKINQGRMDIFSHDGYAVFDESREKYIQRPSFFEGTVINIKLKCNESFYSLASETEPGSYF